MNEGIKTIWLRWGKDPDFKNISADFGFTPDSEPGLSGEVLWLKRTDPDLVDHFVPFGIKRCVYLPSCLSAWLQQQDERCFGSLICVSRLISGTCHRWSCWWTTIRASRRRSTLATTASPPASSWERLCWPGSTTLQRRWSVVWKKQFPQKTLRKPPENPQKTLCIKMDSLDLNWKLIQSKTEDSWTSSSTSSHLWL